MKKNFASILITNFNKGRFLERTLKSCLNQRFKEKEILLYDDASTDNSLKILKKFNKKIKIIKNKDKKFNTGPLNQINGIVELFLKSKGEIIFLLDGDDFFKENKLKYITQIFKKNKKLNFLQDTPYLYKEKQLRYVRKKKHFFSIWPSFHPTSSIVVRRNYFKNFLKFLEKEKFPNLEIDARL